MRRDQRDGLGQPVRNLAGNPRFTTAAGTQVIRTNLVQNPSGESTGATPINVRTNLVLNPRGVYNYSDYSGPTNQTITQGVAVSDHPEGITTANRVTYTGTSINPGVSLMFPAASTTYTISAWVYHESTLSTQGTQGLAQAGVASMPSPPAIVVGQWTRLTWQYTTGVSTNQVGFRVSGGSGTGTGSFLITGALVEATKELVPFYDGASTASGDFTYAWSGTANASVSYQKAPSVGYYAGTNTTAVYQSKVSPYSGSNCIAVLTRGINGDGTFLSNISIVAGTTYTASAWVKVTGSHPMTGVFRFYDSGNATVGSDIMVDLTASLVVGSWVRVSWSAVAPATATAVQTMFRVYSASYAPAVYYLDQVMVEAATQALTYFDGNTPAAGDFTYGWTGSVLISPSVQRATIVAGTAASRNSSGALDSRFSVYQSTAEDGTKTAKWVTFANTGNSTWRVAAINGSSSVGWDYREVKAGGRYTLMMRYRGSGWGTNQTALIQIADGSSLNAVIGYDTGQPANTTGWVEYRRTFTAIRDATVASTVYVSLPTIPQTTTDGIFEMRDWMLVSGEYTGDIIDGDQPYSKWEGTAHQSASVGYPQGLYAIAGKPILDLTTAGTYILDDSFGGAEPRTFYSVVENLSENLGAVAPFYHYGEATLTDAAGTNTYIQFRQDQDSTAGNGTNNLFVRRTGAGGVARPIKIARYVSCWGVNNSGFLYHGVNGAIPTTDSSVMNMPHQKLALFADNATNKHIRTIAFRGVHDDATRLAISRYLGNKYGANVV